MIKTKKRQTTGSRRRTAVQSVSRRKVLKPSAKPRQANTRTRTYDKLKEFRGAKYTGMAIGRSHKWNYDPGEWKESKITPDLWEFSFAVTKRRAYRAPEGSGAAVGTGYHWYILAHQNVFKLDANDYSTFMSGLKFKVAHKRSNKGTWSASAKAQRKRIIELLEENLKALRAKPVPLEFEFNGQTMKGEAVPVKSGCHDGICDQHQITLNNEAVGLIRCTKSGWRMSGVQDEKLIEAIGHELFLWYE
jgi:hypothetical protein